MSNSRIWFKFTTRDLLWLTVVVALGLGWYSSVRRWRDYTLKMNYWSKLAVQEVNARLVESNRPCILEVEKLKQENAELRKQVHALTDQNTREQQAGGDTANGGEEK